MGTRIPVVPSISPYEDHPHAYGDKTDRERYSSRRKGSSPRVWGQAPQGRYLLRYSRIIPTRMGTRDFLPDNIFHNWDHPHAYGDKYHHRLPYMRSLGSSPRVWGQEQARHKDSKLQRIIPTRMGTRVANFYNGMGA